MNIFYIPMHHKNVYIWYNHPSQLMNEGELVASEKTRNESIYLLNRQQWLDVDVVQLFQHG